MIDQNLIPLLRKPLSIPDAEIHARYSGRTLLSYISNIERNVAKGHETLESERALCASEDVLSHPLCITLKELECLALRLTTFLRPAEAEEHADTFDERWDRAVEEWRTDHAYLTEREMAAYLTAYGERCMINGGYWTLTRVEADALLTTGSAGA